MNSTIACTRRVLNFAAFYRIMVRWWSRRWFDTATTMQSFNGSMATYNGWNRSLHRLSPLVQTGAKPWATCVASVIGRDSLKKALPNNRGLRPSTYGGPVYCQELPREPPTVSFEWVMPFGRSPRMENHRFASASWRTGWHTGPPVGSP